MKTKILKIIIYLLFMMLIGSIFFLKKSDPSLSQNLDAIWRGLIAGMVLGILFR